MNVIDFQNMYMQTIVGQMPLPQSIFRKFLDWLQEEHDSETASKESVMKLIAISATAPTFCTQGQHYYNTSSNKIFTATGANVWGTDGETPDSNTLYVLLDTGYALYKLYYYNSVGHRMILLSGLCENEEYDRLETYSKNILGAINEANQTVFWLGYISNTDPSGESDVPYGYAWFDTSNNKIKVRLDNSWSSEMDAIDGKLYVGPDSKLYVFDAAAGQNGELVLFTTKFGIAPSIPFEYDNGTLTLTIGGRTFSLTATEVVADAEE